jgi:N-acetylmuramoyl-L-alanine amidase
MIRAIQHFHNVPRGWDDIGYNFLIGGYGKVYMDRGWDKIGVHTQGMNSVSGAFCLMGNFMNVEPNNNMIETLKNLVECGVDKKYVAPDYQMH